jgi:hypothetical protein
MSEQHIAFHYAEQMEGLSQAVTALAEDIEKAAAGLDSSAAVVGTLGTQATTVKKSVDAKKQQAETALGQANEVTSLLNGQTIISPDHPRVHAAKNDAGEGTAAVKTVRDKQAEISSILETEATTFGSRKTLMEQDGTALKECVTELGNFAIEVTGAADTARPAW